MITGIHITFERATEIFKGMRLLTITMDIFYWAICMPDQMLFLIRLSELKMHVINDPDSSIARALAI